MNWVDLFLGLAVALALLGGFRRGISRIVSGWLGLILGILCAVLFFKPVKGFLLGLMGLNISASAQVQKAMPSTAISALMTVVAFALLLVGVNLLVRLLGRGIHGLMDSIGLAWLDGLLGAAVSLVLAVIALALVLGMGKPLLEMASSAHLTWAAAVQKELDASYLAPWLKAVYQQWGQCFATRI